MIFRKGEIVKIISTEKYNKHLLNKIGVIHTVNELELPKPFVVYIYEDILSVGYFEFYQLELIDGYEQFLTIDKVNKNRHKYR